MIEDVLELLQRLTNVGQAIRPPSDWLPTPARLERSALQAPRVQRQGPVRYSKLIVGMELMALLAEHERAQPLVTGNHQPRH